MNSEEIESFDSPYKSRLTPRLVESARKDGKDKLGFLFALAVDKTTSNIYITDHSNSQILIFSAEGNYLSKLQSDVSQPCGISINRDRVYITQNPGHSICAFDMNGKRIIRVGHEGSKRSEFVHPYHLTTDDVTGLVFVCDMFNNRVQIFTQDCEFVTMFGEHSLNKPISISYTQERIAVIQNDLAGTVIFFQMDYPFVKSIATNSKFPRSIMLDRWNNFLVAGYYGDEVVILSREGQVLQKIPVQKPNSMLAFDDETLLVISEGPDRLLII